MVRSTMTSVKVVRFVCFDDDTLAAYDEIVTAG